MKRGIVSFLPEELKLLQGRVSFPKQFFAEMELNAEEVETILDQLPPPSGSQTLVLLRDKLHTLLQ